MKLSPIDIEQQKFNRVFRGCAPGEVQRFLEVISGQTAELNRELMDTKAELKRAKRDLEELRSREESLKEAMFIAQRAIDDLRENANKEAQLILNEAELRAEKVLHAAHRQATEIHEEINELRRQRIRFVEELRGVVSTHARLLDVHDEEARSPALAESVHIPSRRVLERVRAPAPPGALHQLPVDDGVSTAQ